MQQQATGPVSSAQPIDFEATLLARLNADCDALLAGKLHSAYVSTKTKLQEQVYDRIAAAEPNLTDHGVRHVDNVLGNALRLLGDDGTQALSGRDLYCLGMSILFHDAGNLEGRTDHRDEVSRMHDDIRGTDKSLLREKTLIVRAARAHTGRALDGSTDTLKEVANAEPLEGGRVKLREVAALLRLADELAEGPQRTSQLVQDRGGYAPDSTKYHEYASSVHVLIERIAARVVMMFEIDLPDTKDDRLWQESLKTRLAYAYTRIQKLDQERRYTGFYSEILRAFRSTEVSFNFHHAGEIVEVGLGPLKLTDIVLPNGPQREIPSIDPAYNLETLVPRLAAAAEDGKEAQ